MKDYAYMFTIGGSVQWSGESAERIRDVRFKRASAETLRDLIEFFEHAEPGDHIQLEPVENSPESYASIIVRTR